MKKLKSSALSSGVARTIPRRGPRLLITPQLGYTIRSMLEVSSRWESMNSWREKNDLAPLPPPFPESVMGILERTNQLRIEAERKAAAEQKRLHLEEAAYHAKRQMMRPNVSRRVLNERRKRAEQQIEERREKASREKGDVSGREDGNPSGMHID